MPAPPLNWKEGEGFDIHLLRNGPESKPLIDALDIDPGQKAQVIFLPRLAADSSHHGIGVTSPDGVVNAITPPDASLPKVRNFILTAIFTQPSLVNFEAEIRIHIHDSVKDIWLTPPTLTIYKDSNECRFTVLARFNDDSVGDITDWSELTYQSSAPSVATVDPKTGVLKAEATSGTAPITVNLKVPALGIDKTSAPAKALVKPSWADVAKAAKVSFVAGRVAPDESNPSGPEANSVKSVVENGRNILFIAEGFQQDQRFDFRNIVNLITSVLRGEEAATASAFQPFGILKKAINYWVVFVPSEEDGITVLGRHMFIVQDGKEIGILQSPNTRPDPAATKWKYPELLYEVGLPLAGDATRLLPDLVDEWQKLFGTDVTLARTTDTFNVLWKLLPFHSILNERDTAFGYTVGIRQRIDWKSSDAVTLDFSSRRTSSASFRKFVENLTFGGFPIGDRWKTGAPDFSLVSLLCLTDRQSGAEVGDKVFAAGTGRNESRVSLKKAPDSGLQIVTAPVISTHRHLMASVFSHELGHAFGLGDEYGDGGGASLTDGSDVNPFQPNVQAKTEIAPAPAAPATVAAYDSTKIRWAWPRITKAGVLTRKIEAGDVTTAGIRVPLKKRHGRNFAVGDVVRFKAFPVSFDARLDEFADQFLKVKTVEDDAVVLVPVTTTAGTSAVTEVTMSTFDTSLFLSRFSVSTSANFSLIKPLRRDGVEIKLVPPSILKRIDDTDDPLNANPAAPHAACTAAGHDGVEVMTPRNLPTLSRLPPTKADIIGIYEGGVNHDCGVFHAAGRCKMRSGGKLTVPFCFVCRYIIVDTVDPTRHGELDLLYPEVTE